MTIHLFCMSHWTQMISEIQKRRWYQHSNFTFICKVHEQLFRAQPIHVLVFVILMFGATNAQVEVVLNDTTALVCNGIIFKDRYYDKELLYSGSGKSYNLMMHHNTNELFFCHTVWNETTQSFIPGFKACDLGTKTCRDIKGASRGFSIAYDTENDNIYFGSFDGLFRYDKLTRDAVYYAERHRSVWALFYFKTLFYVDYPNHQLYVLKSGRFMKSRIRPQILVFLAMRKYFYFANHTGLYKIDRRHMDEVIVLRYRIDVKQITQDIHGNVYFCTTDGIYMEDKPFLKVKKVASLKIATGMTFLNAYDNKTFVLIYSVRNKIYKLVPSRYSHLCINALVDSGEEDRPPAPTGVSLNVNLHI